jgi:hypothetical protein
VVAVPIHAVALPRWRSTSRSMKATDGPAAHCGRKTRSGFNAGGSPITTPWSVGSSSHGRSDESPNRITAAKGASLAFSPYYQTRPLLATGALFLRPHWRLL